MKTTENCYSPSNDKFNQSDPTQSIVALSSVSFYIVPSYRQTCMPGHKEYRLVESVVRRLQRDDRQSQNYTVTAEEKKVKG